MKDNFCNFLQTSLILDQWNIFTDWKSCIWATELICNFKIDVIIESGNY